MSYKVSSYWLDDRLDHETKEDKKDPLRLSAYRNAIANFVSIVTGENIPVTFKKSGSSFTNGKEVTISSRLGDKDFDHTVGLALHEGSHIKLTNFDVLARLEDWIQKQDNELLAYMEKYNETSRWEAGYTILGKLKDLLNIIEDRRIDNFVYRSAPGYKGYYQALYDKYFNSKIIDKGLKSDEYRTEDWDSYMFRICNITNPNRDLDALKGLRAIWKIMDLKNISRLKNTNDARDIAWKIFLEAESHIEAPKPSSSQEQEDDPKKDDSKKSDCTSNESSCSKPKGDDGKKEKDDGSKAEGKDVKRKNETLSENQKRQLKKAIAKQKDFTKGDIKKVGVNRKLKQVLDAMNTAGITQNEVEVKEDNDWRRDVVTKHDVIVIRNLTKDLIHNMDCGMWSSSDYHKDTVASGLRLGAILGKKLKIRAEERSTKFNRRRSGKIDRRMISNAGFGAENIFEKLETFAYDPGMIHISIDNSGSMSGEKFKKSIKTAIAIAKACSLIENMDCVISLRAGSYLEGMMKNAWSYDDKPVMLIAYDSRRHGVGQLRLFSHLRVSGCTPEGLCFDAIMKEIIDASRGKDAYFLNFSDGMPYFDGYGGGRAVRHTRRQVKKMKKEGIKVLSYYISSYGASDKENSNFKRMYGSDAECINTDNISAVARTMNAKFLEVA